jgi:D-ribose pyranase
MAEEFLRVNAEEVQARFRDALAGRRIEFEPHVALKMRTAGAIGLIRTADTIQYANIVLESA